MRWADKSTNSNPENIPDAAPNTVVFDTKGIFSTPQTITLKPSLFEQILGPIDFEGTMLPEVIDGLGSSMLTISGGRRTEDFIVSETANARLNGLTITEGAGSVGSAIGNDGGVLTVDDCVLSDNVAAVAGGAIDNALRRGIVTIIDSTFVDNRSPTDGLGGDAGAILNLGTMMISNSTFTGNTARGLGGAIENVTDLTLSNVTFSGNSAGMGGGAVDLISGTLTTVNVTIAGNSVDAPNSGGGLNVSGGRAALYNTIVASNTMGTGSGAPASDIDVVSRGTLSGSFNLIGTGGSGGLANGVNNNQVGVANPLLGGLGSNGGSTQTIALLPGSPAIGAGSRSIPGIIVPSTDQRGVTRPPNRIDVGAFQDQGFVLKVVSASSPQTTLVNSAFPNPLAVIVTSPAGDPVAGGLIIFTAPSSGATAVLTGSPARIGPNGRAAVTAVANGTAGSYKVRATTAGATAPATFSLTNQALAALTSVSVKWGIARTDALIIPALAGGTLLPAGRQTDVPWLGINQFVITLSRSTPLTRYDVSLTSAIGKQYGPLTVTGTGPTYSIVLGTPIKQPDIVTLMISATGITPFAAALPILPGDFNDNGKVDYPDETGVLAEILGRKPTIFGDINGDGVVNQGDYMAVLANLGNKLPPRMAPSFSMSVLTTAGSAATAALAPRAEVRLARQSKIRIGGSPSRVVIQISPQFRGRSFRVKQAQVS